VTSTGLVLIPLALLTILLPWRYSVLALLVFATMDSAAVVNAGSVGLQPGYFFGLLMVGRTIVEMALLRTPLNGYVIRLMAPLLLFTVVCVISIWIGLTFFQGRVMVVSSQAFVNVDLAQPYMFQRQNLTQPFYLFLNVAILYALAHQLARMPAQDVARIVDRAVVGAILFASAVAIWEMAHYYAGFPFADSFFHSNAGYAKAHGQVLSGAVLRTSGPFTEPAALGYYFGGFLFFAWYRYLQRPSPVSIMIVLLCLVVMAASTSTTAFAVMAIFPALLLKDALVAARTRVGNIRVSASHVMTLAVTAVAAVVAIVFLESHWRYVDEILTQMVFQKQETGSFKQRTGVDRVAVDIVMQTGGIGVGLGSHKPNTLPMTLLSNTGVAGFLTFAVFVFEVLRPPSGIHQGVNLRSLRWLVAGLLVVHLMVNPNLSSIILWIGFGLIVGTRYHLQRPTSVMVDWFGTQREAAFVQPQAKGVSPLTTALERHGLHTASWPGRGT